MPFLQLHPLHVSQPPSTHTASTHDKGLFFDPAGKPHIRQANFQKLLKWPGKMAAKEPQDYKIKIDFFFIIKAF